MADDSTHSNIRQSRAALAAATAARVRQTRELSEAADALRSAQRSTAPGGPAVTAALGRYEAARAALEASGNAERAAGLDLNTLLAAADDPVTAIGGMDKDYPIVLLPVRLETRFVRFDVPVTRVGASDYTGELRVRIYPDGIMSDMHEPLLTDNEVSAGRDYWRGAWRQADEQDAWTALVSEVGAPRAAWIVRQCEPANIADFPVEAGASGPEPDFPVLETRDPNKSRSPVARLLPDRWIVQASPMSAITPEERERYRVVGRPIVEPLALSFAFDRGQSTANPVELLDQLKVDEEIRWVYEFDRAEEIGMAIRMPLIEVDFEEGFATVIVVGANTSLDPESAATALEELLDSHHYTRGFGFVPQGTPTNNTVGTASGFPPPDPRARNSFRTERTAPLTRPGGDGRLFARAFGIDEAVLDHVGGADLTEQASAGAMAEALWPASIGYFMRQALATDFDVEDQASDLDEETIEQLRDYYVRYIRGRGPLPAVRVGDVPYGILPVSTLGDIDPDVPAAGDDPIDHHLRVDLAMLRESKVRAAVDHAPRIGRTSNPEEDLMSTFRMHASAREVFIRSMIGEETVDNLAGFGGRDAERFREPIDLNAPIDLGGPPGIEAGELTLKTLLRFSDEIPDVIEDAEGAPGRGRNRIPGDTGDG